MKLTKTLPVICALFLAQHALAQTCDTVAVGTPIYIGGSTALQPFVAAVGPKLSASADGGYTLFYYGGGSCNGVNNILGTFPLAASTSLTYYVANPDGGTAAVAKTCTLPASQDGGLDVGISDVFVETCGAIRPATVADVKGPAQAMAFVTSKLSTQTAITAEEAYIAIGFGGVTYQAPPWTADPATSFFFRADSSGTKRILASAIGLNWTKWKGQQTSGSGAVFSGLAGITSASAGEASLGILGMDYLDQSDANGPRRNQVKQLAFSAVGQKYAYYPDSSTTSFDKKNLREGRYGGLGYAHFLYATTAGGAALQPKAQYIVDLLTGGTVTPAPTFDVTATITKDAHLVPLCAMKVERTAEGADLKAYHPANNCSCYFESLVGTPPASCVQCTTSCASGTCRNGWCEAN